MDALMNILANQNIGGQVASAFKSSQFKFDFQTDKIYGWDWDVKHSSSERRRRQNWSKRPQEIRAQKQEKDSLHFLNANPKYKVALENLIIDFAVEMSEKPWR
jgi:hypothetical protein